MKFEPVRFSAALSAFGTALIALLALLFAWTAPVILAVGGVWAAAVGLFNASFVRNQVTPNAAVEQVVHDTIVALAPSAPVVVSGDAVPGVVTPADVVAVLPEDSADQ